ncbi:hypothetical protein DACRYDRAFT_24560 [Dacryopinax primogenitus]|uniref:DUF6534 domain-containing protein n=1 Tax=Dacryopinax primogenitus (strain DJM 731) TaxID=1858805 RepID=M5FYC7_DACPD|nr:uncharacterized protein DACRYDRAFT_24560 [Dacryopinax primogenitus]EJT98556.1 hypothetical protein DACRYDRAFT_24560 [Dacryopinax primogenitus]
MTDETFKWSMKFQCERKRNHSPCKSAPSFLSLLGHSLCLPVKAHKSAYLPYKSARFPFPFLSLDPSSSLFTEALPRPLIVLPSNRPVMSAANPGYAPSPTQMDLTDDLGGLFVGMIISTMLLGMGLAQTWFYYRTFPDDPIFTKWMVGVSCFVNVLHGIMLPKCIWYWVVTNWGNTASLNYVDFSYNVNLTLTGLLSFLVQVFFAHRIYILSHRSLFLPIIILVLSLLQFAFSLASTIRAFQLVLQSSFGVFTWGVDVWMYCAAGADIIIAASVVTYLRREGKAAWGGTKGIVEKLIVITLESNLLTAILSIIVAILFTTTRNGWPNAINFVAVRMYFISLIRTQVTTARHELTKKLESSGVGAPAFHMSPVNIGPRNLGDNLASNMLSGVRIMSHTTTELDEPLPRNAGRRNGINHVELGVASKINETDEVNCEDTDTF